MSYTDSEPPRRARKNWPRPVMVVTNEEELAAQYYLDTLSYPAEERRLTVSWEVDGADVVADLKADGRGQIEVARFEVKTSSGTIPRSARRLPSDATILRSLSGSKVYMRYALRYLLGQQPRMIQLGRARLAVGDELGPELFDDVLRDYVLEVTVGSRSRTRAETQVGWVRSRLEKNDEAPRIKTKEIVAHLVAEGVTEATAYRRLREARRRIALDKEAARYATSQTGVTPKTPQSNDTHA